MICEVRASTSTGLSPEWDRWFDETFTDLIAGDEDLLRAEFDDLIAASWPGSPVPPVPPAPPASSGDDSRVGSAPAGPGATGEPAEGGEPDRQPAPGPPP